jgi:hypothetical protein
MLVRSFAGRWTTTLPTSVGTHLACVTAVATVNDAARRLER